MTNRRLGGWTISRRTPLRSRFTHEADSGRSRSTALTTALMSRRPGATRPAGPLVYLNLREPPLSEIPRIYLPGTSVNKGIKKGRISERSGPRMIPAALGGVPRSVSNLRGPSGMGGRNGIEENRPLRKPLAAVLVVVWIELVLTTAVASRHRSGVVPGSV